MPDLVAPKGSCRSLILAALAGLVLTACANNRSDIDAKMESMAASQTDPGAPGQYVEMFPGNGEDCGYPNRAARAWNTHPVRAIKASFARILPSGARDYFNIDIPPGEIMTVEQCSAGQPELIEAQFVDQG